MHRILLLVLLIAAIVVTLRLKPTRYSAKTQAKRAPSGESSPICPWREPERDLKVLFPNATHYVTETRILSGLMVPIQKRLKRAMTVDENPLRVYRAMNTTGALGSVLVKRVKGEDGGIEIVMGVDAQGSVRRVLMQSQREPEAITAAMTNWLEHFTGKTAASPLCAGQDLPDVSTEARITAEALADGVRSELIVLSFAENPIQAPESITAATH